MGPGAVVAVLLFATAWLGGVAPAAPADDVLAPVLRVPGWDRIEHVSYSGYRPADGLDLLVLDSDEAWRAFWVEHRSIVTPPSPVPEVDFQTFWIAALVYGPHRTCGYDILVEEVGYVPVADHFVVAYRTTELPVGFVCHMVTTNVDIVRVPRLVSTPPQAVFAGCCGEAWAALRPLDPLVPFWA